MADIYSFFASSFTEYACIENILSRIYLEFRLQINVLAECD